MGDLHRVLSTKMAEMLGDKRERNIAEAKVKSYLSFLLISLSPSNDSMTTQ
jgi:hypothetical protein